MKANVYITKEEKRNKMDSFDKFLLCSNYSITITIIIALLGMFFIFNPEQQNNDLIIPFSFICGFLYYGLVRVFKRTLFTNKFTF